MKSMNLESDAFRPNEAIPRAYTGEGQDISPPLRWEAAPAGTKEFALIVDDPDAPSPEPWVHWVLYKIPADVHELPERIAPALHVPNVSGALQGINSWKRIGYGGPMPPVKHGMHHYHFKVYALDMPLTIDPGVSKQILLEAMHGHVLAEGELVGTYHR